MSYEIPEDVRYVESHEWARRDGDRITVGITDFAQDELGDVVFVELPEVGEQLDREAAFGVVESIKAVSDVYTPVGGEITDRNETLFDEPELVNESPYDDGWMVRVEPADPDEYEGLLTPEVYRDQIE
jgi:glycine cleavage system H protein